MIPAQLPYLAMPYVAGPYFVMLYQLVVVTGGDLPKMAEHELATRQRNTTGR